MIDRYLNELAIAGYRPDTIEARRYCLKAFEQHVAPRPLRETTRTDIEAFLARPLSANSRRNYRSHIRCLFSWAVDRDLLAVDPSAKVPSVRIPRSVPRPIPDAELARAIELAPRRMRTWLLLMALAGLRAIEVANLHPEDVLDSPAGTLLFLRECKGGGTATVPAHRDVIAALNTLPVRDGAWWRVSAAYVSEQVSSYLRSIGIRATGHQLRHSAGTAWYRASGHDLLATAALMRHSSVNTTQIYAQLDPTRPAEVVAAVRTPRPRLQAV